MKTTEFYLKLDIKDREFNSLDLEQIFHDAIKKEIGRNMKFPEEDISVMPIEFYERNKRESK